jgi:CHAT domain-containing protein/tetratricopeptide (TPR) repeat protein
MRRFWIDRYREAQPGTKSTVITTNNSRSGLYWASGQVVEFRKIQLWRCGHRKGITTAFWILLLLANQESVLSLLGQQSIHYSTTQLNDKMPGDLHQALSMKLAALQRFRSRVKRAREAVADQQLEAVALDDIGQLYSETGDKQKALDYYNQALPLWRNAKDQQGEAITLNNIGEVYSDSGDKQKALDYYNQALTLLRAMDGPVGVARILNNIGAIYSGSADKQKALNYYDQALTLLRAMDDHDGEAMILNNIGLVYGDLGGTQKALEYYNQALPMQQEVGDRAAEAGTLNNVAAIYSRIGQKGKALEQYMSALRLLQSMGDPVSEGRTLTNIGCVYADLGEKQMALDYYLDALKLLRKLSTPADEATTLNNIGTIYSGLGDQPKALDYYNQALALQVKGDQVGRALTLNNMGAINSSLGQKEQALYYYNQAVSLEREVGDVGKEAITLANLAALQDDKEQGAAAVDNYNQALALSVAVADQLTEAGVLSALMFHWNKSGNMPFAILFGKQAVNVYQQIRGNLESLDKELQRSFTTSVSGTYRELADLLVGQGRLVEALDVLDLLKEEEYTAFTRGSVAQLGRQLAETASERRATESIGALTGKFAAISNQAVDLAHRPFRTAKEEAKLAELTSQASTTDAALTKLIDALDRSFASSNPGDQGTLLVEQLNSPGAAAWEKQVQQGTLALYTLVADEHFWVLMVNSSTISARRYEILRDNLRIKIRNFRRALRDPASDPLPPAQALYKILIAPLEADLEALQPHTLIWSLDDQFRYVPMAALHDGHHYLVERYANDVITFAGSSEATLPLDVANVRGVAMGISDKYEEGLDPLSAVPAELNRIVHDPAVKQSHGAIPGTIKLNNDFTEKTLTEQLQQGYPIVHIASHFNADPRDDANSYLLLAGKESGGAGYHLSLAAIREDARMRFDGVEFLALSACQTALGGSTLDGREVDGLGTVAQKKGAKTVLASLWSVEDASTGWLMGDLYQRWITGGVSKAEALRQAQLDLLLGKVAEKDVSPPAGKSSRKTSHVERESEGPVLKTYSHPYYWAPFILMGSWR